MREPDRDRLHSARFEGEDRDVFFWGPTRVDSWRHFFNRQNRVELNGVLISNLAHRCQYLEYLAAHLRFDQEIADRTRDQRRSLHETVSRFSVHTFVVVAFSVIEGLAVQVSARVRGAPNRIRQEDWILDLSNAMAPQEPDFLPQLERLQELRNQIHLDRIQETDDIHFNALGFEEFDRASGVLVTVLGWLNPDLPNSSLNA